jgi:pyruvate/2-oxoglutarate dehydrogenase complex dihydrolipoamide dehydrogenase (E3) component
VIGAGFVGLEAAQALRRFGSKVTVLERNERLRYREEDDVTEGLRTLFESEGIELALNTKIQRVSGKSGQSVKVDLQQNGVDRTIVGSHLLVALGRIPNTQGIGLELAGSDSPIKDM